MAKVSALNCGTSLIVTPLIPTLRPLMALHLLKPVCEWMLEDVCFMSQDEKWTLLTVLTVGHVSDPESAL